MGGAALLLFALVALTGSGGLRASAGPTGPEAARERRLQLLTHEARTPDELRGAPSEPMTLTFYLYRAQDDTDYPLENVNAGDLPGVLWYLHNEVVGSTPRKFHVSRIIRYKVTTRTTDRNFQEHRSNFGPFVAFDWGQCTVRDCDRIWLKYGFNIGCQVLNSTRNAYYSPFLTHGWEGHDGLWYSLPGPCPSLPHGQKTPECMDRMPGGQCNDAGLLGRPGVDCTYFVERAGEIRLDELSNITDYERWWAVEKNHEYIWDLDVGRGTDFWNHRRDKRQGARRMQAVQNLFRKRHPDLPVTYGEPPCDML